MSNITVTNNWKFSIMLKDVLNNETSDEAVLRVSKRLVSELKRLYKRVEKSNLVEEEKKWVIGELDELIGHFEFTVELTDGTIPKDKRHEYEIDSVLSLLNGNISLLYDLGDTRVKNTKQESEKLFLVK